MRRITKIYKHPLVNLTRGRAQFIVVTTNLDERCDIRVRYRQLRDLDFSPFAARLFIYEMLSIR